MASRKEGTNLGPYRIVEQVGMGGMATVYKAYQASMDRFVALKILPAHFAQDPKFVERFNREARTIAKLEHKNILPVYDFGEENGVTYLAMRYLDGGTLKDVLGLGRITLADAVDIMAQVCAALDYAHRQGIIHRDVKPANIMIDSEGAAYLTDFGIAKVLENITGGLTETGAAVGTPAYMAPEQSLGKPVDARSDIYALGVVLFEMVTGRPPYQADTPMAVALAHIHEPLPLPHEIDQNIPEDIETVILKALAKDPAHRYASAGEMAGALEDALASSGAAAGAATTLRALAVQAGEQVATRTVKIEGDLFAAPTATRAKAAPKELGLPLWAGIAICAVLVLGAVLGVLALLGVFEGVGGDGGETTSDEFLYDDFEDPEYDGTVNTSLWREEANNVNCSFYQEDGVLVIDPGSAGLNASCYLTVGRPGTVAGTDLGAIEARMRVLSDDASGYVSGRMYNITYFEGDNHWFAECSMATEPSGPIIFFRVAQRTGGEDTDVFYQTFTAEYDTWYTLRLEVDPATLNMTCSVDGTVIGSHIPDHADEMAPLEYVRTLSSNHGSSDLATFEIDYVRIEPVETSEGDGASVAQVYDSFDDPAFSGAYNPDLWAQPDFSTCEFIQDDGALTLTGQSEGERGCILAVGRPAEVSVDEVETMEARVQVESDHTGGYVAHGLGVGIARDGQRQAGWQAMCAIAASPDGVSLIFAVGIAHEGEQSEEQFRDQFIASYDTWYSLRMTVDPETMEVSCWADGDLIGSVVPETAIAAADLPVYRGIVAARGSGANGTTRLDDFYLLDPGETSGAGEDLTTSTEAVSYDTFDNTLFDGGYDPERWVLDQESVCDFRQHDGAMVIPGLASDDEAWCVLEMTEMPLADREGSLLANLQITDDLNGGYVENTLKLGVYVDGGAWWAADCGLAADESGVWSVFWIRNINADGDFNAQAETAGSAEVNQWHEIRLYFNPTSGEVACGVDGEVIGQAVPDHFAAAQGGAIYAGLAGWRDAGAAATTLVDDFFILP